jgi:hypothetical protein
MIINFRIRKINRDTRKLTQTPMLIKKINFYKLHEEYGNISYFHYIYNKMHA